MSCHLRPAHRDPGPGFYNGALGRAADLDLVAHQIGSENNVMRDTMALDDGLAPAVLLTLG